MLTLDFKIITKSICLLNGFSIGFPFSGDMEKKFQRNESFSSMTLKSYKQRYPRKPITNEYLCL